MILLSVCSFSMFLSNLSNESLTSFAKSWTVYSKSSFGMFSSVLAKNIKIVAIHSTLFTVYVDM